MNNKKKSTTKKEISAWIEEEFESINLGDYRLNQRLKSIVQSLEQHPQTNIPQAMGSWAASKSAYRFLANTKTSGEKVHNAHKLALKKRISALKEKEVILAVQDTSYLDYTTHTQTKDLGHISFKENSQGILYHPTLGVSTGGLPLGIMHYQVLTRKELGTKAKRRERAVAEKESRKWLESYRVTCEYEREMQGVHFVNICDREGDVYDLFLEAHQAPSVSDLLVRAAWDRRIEEEQGSIWKHMEKQPVAAHIEVLVPKKERQPQREAKLAVKYGEVHIKAPWSRYQEKLPVLKLGAVYAQEEQTPQGIEPLSWLLLTTMPVNDVEAALEKLEWYTRRWLIEMFFRVLKSGGKVENRRFKNLQRQVNCLTIDSVVAWRILFTLLIGREQPDLPASVLFEECEWKALYCYINKARQTPKKEPSLSKMIVEVAKLGGYLARKNDGPPGMTTLWRGLQALYHISQMWNIYNPSEGSIHKEGNTCG